jgi:hypothetical protein
MRYDWLPADDDANTSHKFYYVPKPEEIYQRAAEERAKRTEDYTGPHTQNRLCAVPVRKRAFE